MPNLTLQLLAEKYKIVSKIDLGLMTDSPSAVYDFFNKNYQIEYSPDQRLVFFTKHIVSDSLLTHLYDAAKLIDISNCFILICSPDKNLDAHVKEVAKKLLVDPFETAIVPVDYSLELKNSFILPKTICPMPWMHIEIDNQGNIKPCCISNTTLGNINNISPITAFMSHKMTQIRVDMLKGEQPLGCAECWQNESNGLTSNRIRHLKLLAKDFLIDKLSNPTISSVDIKPGNTCNFKCRICSPLLSSLHEAEQSKVTQIKIKKSINWVNEESAAFDHLNNLLPKLTNIDMYGGEPFLIKKLDNLVESAVTQGLSKNIRLHYNTNGSIFPDKLIPLWAQFLHVDIHVSIDNVGKRFELERGGEWKNVENNILKLVKLNLPNLKISVMPTISMQNIFYVDELLTWTNNLNLSVNFNFLSSPKGYALTQLTDCAKKLLVKKYKNSTNQEVQNILKMLESLPPGNGVEFCKITKYYDDIRKENFAETHPEIASAMGYVYNSQT